MDELTRITSMVEILRFAAPEKSTDLERLFEGFDLNFVVVIDEDRPIFRATPKAISGRKIEMAQRALHRFWANSFSYLWLYEEAAKTRESGSDKFEAAEDHPALQLLNWSVLGEINIELQRRIPGTFFTPHGGFYKIERTLDYYPTGVPAAFSTGEPGGLLTNATRLFRLSVGFLLHHELAHFRIQPGVSATTDIEEEDLADSESAGWMLEGLDPSESRFIERSIGICVGLLWLVVVEAYLGPAKLSEHPPGFARLVRFLNERVIDPSHPAWAFTAVILHFHLDNLDLLSGLSWPPKNARDAVERYVEIVANKTQ